MVGRDSLQSSGSPVDTAAGAQPEDAVIHISGLSKTFDSGTAAVRDFTLQVADGELVSLVGPSGCGKTTILRSIAGLEQPDQGVVEVGGRLVFDSSRRFSLPPEKRGVSMVFQHYALWPHMNVFENVAFGLRTRKTPRAEIPHHVERVLRLVRLSDKRDERVSHLSGGQQQRAALARALAFEPRVVLLDEPLSNLDAKLREEMRLELQALQRKLGFSALYVTHDQDEAMSLSSRVAVMNEGIIEQSGEPSEVWRHPATPFVASFFGSTNRLTGVVGDPKGTDLMMVRTMDGPTLEVPIDRQLRSGEQTQLFVRSSDVQLVAGTDAPPNDCTGVVKLLTFQGETVLAQVEFGTGTIMARCPPTIDLQEGAPVGVRIDPSSIRAYPM